MLFCDIDPLDLDRTLARPPIGSSSCPKDAILDIEISDAYTCQYSSCRDQQPLQHSI